MITKYRLQVLHVKVIYNPFVELELSVADVKELLVVEVMKLPVTVVRKLPVVEVVQGKK